MSSFLNAPNLNHMDIVDEILQSANDARYLKASSQLQGLEALMDPDNELFCGDTEEKRLRRKLEQCATDIQQIRDRAYKIQSTIALEESMGRNDSEWIYGTKYFGVTTYYKLTSDGCITVRMEGGLDDLPIFEQAAVIHDAENFKDWVPFCDESILLEKLAPSELLLYISVSVPLAMSRDTCLHAYAADCLYEHGKILLVGNSVEHEEGKRIGDDATEGCEAGREPGRSISTIIRGSDGNVEKVISHSEDTVCPWKRTGWGSDRMYIQEFTAIIALTGPESAKPTIIARIDPNCGRLVPQWVLNFFIKNLAGVGLHVFQKQVQKVAKRNKLSHGEREKKAYKGTAGKESLEKNRYFYTEWLLPKIRRYAHSKGWHLTDVAVLGEDGLMGLKESDF